MSPSRETLSPLVLATANRGKAREFEEMLRRYFRVVPRPDSVGEIIENAGTLLGNARLKAHAISKATGLAVLADDTGLEVEALHGEPGVDSAYYAALANPNAPHPADIDAANLEHLLAELQRVGALAPPHRKARFRTVLVLLEPDGTERLAQGVSSGVISLSPKGSNGFGYDAIFEPDELQGRTFAEMSPSEKNMISHRAKALLALRQTLEPTPPAAIGLLADPTFWE